VGVTAKPPVELWRVALEYLREHPSTSEPNGRDRALVDALLVELYILGERPLICEVRRALADLGTGESWSSAVIVRWRKRLEGPTWRPRELMRNGGWVRPFVVLESLVAKHGLRPIPERLVDALLVAAADYVRCAEADPTAAATSQEAALYALTAGAVRLWALSRDAVDGLSWPSVLACGLHGNDNLVRNLTNAGRAREGERLKRDDS
jgi:hypothetical protein